MLTSIFLKGLQARRNISRSTDFIPTATGRTIPMTTALTLPIQLPMSATRSHSSAQAERAGSEETATGHTTKTTLQKPVFLIFRAMLRAKAANSGTISVQTDAARISLQASLSLTAKSTIHASVFSFQAGSRLQPRTANRISTISTRPITPCIRAYAPLTV